MELTDMFKKVKEKRKQQQQQQGKIEGVKIL